MVFKRIAAVLLWLLVTLTSAFGFMSSELRIAPSDFFCETLDCAEQNDLGTRDLCRENGWLNYDTLSGYCVAANKSSKILGTTTKQLQKKYKHAGDFGVTGNFNKANASKFNSAINQHINGANTQAIQGTYRGTQDVIHHFDPQTGLNVMSDLKGNFISGWKLSKSQIENLGRSGNIQ